MFITSLALPCQDEGMFCLALAAGRLKIMLPNWVLLHTSYLPHTDFATKMVLQQNSMLALQAASPAE